MQLSDRVCPRCKESGKKFSIHKPYCTDCYNMDQREAYKKTYLFGSSRWINTLTSQTKGRATNLGVPFNEQDVRDVLKNCSSVCPVFKTDFVLGEGLGPKDHSPTLDRIIPELGYVSSNMCVISWKANRIKNASSLEDLQQLTEWLQNVI